jgi:PKD repeat protein
VGGCVRIVKHPIVIHPNPVASFTYAPPCPPPVNITFTSTSTGASTYAWTSTGGTGSGSTYTTSYAYQATPIPFHSYEDTVKLVVISAAGCKDSITIDTVHVRNIIPIINEPQERILLGGCSPALVDLFVGAFTDVLPHSPAKPISYPYGVPTSWRWDFGDGDTSTLANPLHVFTGTTIFTVRCIITTSNGCQDTGYRVVQTDTPVHPVFTVSPDSVCPHIPVTFTNNSSNPYQTIFYWHLDEDTFLRTMITNNSFVHSFRKSQSYRIELFTDHNNCSDTETKILVVKPSSASFTDSLYCSPSTTTQFIDRSVGATSYLWDFGDGSSPSSSANPLHTYPDTGTYFTTLITSNSVFGCTIPLRTRCRYIIP